MLIQPRLLVPFSFERRVFRHYLLRVDFSTDDATPVASPYAGEVGSVTITDTTNTLSVSGGELVPSSAANVARDPWVREVTGFARAAGRALLCRFLRPGAFGSAGNSPLIGWHNTLSTPDVGQTYGVIFPANSGSAALGSDGAGLLLSDTLSNDTYYRVVVVLRSAGFFLLIDDKLAWVGRNGTEGTLYPGVSARIASGRQAKLDYLRVRDLGGSFGSDYGIALVHTSALNGSDYTAAANGIFDLAVTAPASLAGEAGLKFRKNGGDYWKVNLNSSGDLVVQRYASDVAQGSPVTLASGVISGSATRTIRVITNGANMEFYTLSGSSWTKRGSTQTDSHLSANTGISPVADGSWTGGGGAPGQLDAFARSSTQYDILDSI